MGPALLVALFFGLSLAAPSFCGALDPSTPLSQYGRDNWDSDSGLPQNSVQAILQTRDGYLWLGTQEGLVRFDGVRFTIFDTRNTPAMSDDWVQSLCQTRDGTLWIGTLSGLLRYRQEKFEPFGPTTKIARAIVGALLESRDGALWLGTSVGLGRVRGDALELFGEAEGLPSPRVRALAEDRDGGVWAGLGNGIARFRDGKITGYTMGERFPGAGVALSDDGEGGLWVGTGRGLVHWKERVLRHFDEKDGLTNTLARSVMRDREGTVWVGTSGGLFRLRGGRFDRYATENGLSSNRVLTAFEDREGSLWVGTTDGGLDRLKNERVANYTARDGLSDDKIWTVFEDRDRDLWVGTAEGWLNRLPAGGTRFEQVGPMGNIIHAIGQDAAGDLWIGTQGAGLVRRRGNRQWRYTTADGLPSNSVASICPDGRGGIWIGTFAPGLVHYEGGKFTLIKPSPGGLPGHAIFSLYRDAAGDLWIGTFGGGVTRMRGEEFLTLSTKDGLPHDIVMSTFQDGQGSYWFATRGGLSRYRDGRFTTYRQKEGLFHDAVQRVVQDGHGYLWMTSNRGIFRVSEQELAAAAKGRGETLHPVSFATASGLRSAECNNAQHGALRTADGRLWFATVKGLAMADPARIELNRTPPTVVIEQVLSGRERLPQAESRRLPPGRGDLEFHYTALNFRSPAAVRFRYRLEGFDAGWIEAGTRRTAYYTNLPPGGYRFTVLACNEDGVWNARGSSTNFVLEPRFYQTAWFRILGALALALLAFTAHRIRVRRLEAREWFRTALAEAKLHALQSQLRPHFLFNTLNSIVALTGSDPVRARRMIEQLAELLRVSLRTEPGQLVTLEREISILEQYLDIERMRFRDRLEVSIAVEPSVETADVPGFLLQPLVENGIKHGMRGSRRRGLIRIEARKEKDRLLIRIADNGPGWLGESSLPKSVGIGLRNTRRRLEILYPGRHSLDLANLPQGGFEVRIAIPLTFGSAPSEPPGPAEIGGARPFPSAGPRSVRSAAYRSVEEVRPPRPLEN